MCCRYYYSKLRSQELLDELGIEGEDGAVWPGKMAHLDGMVLPGRPYGTVSPSDPSILIAGDGGHFAAKEARFGFPGKNGQLVINARSETALAKPMFSAAMLYRRCVLPAERFFEWDAQKNLAQFEDPAGRLMLLAGLWGLFENAARFVVLTAPANASMAPVHARMPLRIPQENLAGWLFDLEAARRLLAAPQPPLLVRRDAEQMRLF